MTHYTVCCGYASHYHNTVTLEADTLDEALEKAIEQAGDDPHWKSADYCGPTFVEALAEGDGCRPLGRHRDPHSRPFHQERRAARGHADRPPPARRHRGRGRHRPYSFRRTRRHGHDGDHRSAGPAGQQASGHRSDAEPMALRMWPSAAAVHACSFWIPATPDRRRPVDRRRHSSIANRLPCATPGRWPAFGPARTAGARRHPDHRYSRGPFHETVHRRTAHEAACKWDPKGADHKPVVKWFNACGAGTWLLSELDPEYPDECAFGLADLGFGTPELGSIGLLELTEYRGPFGLGIERDIHFTAALSPVHLRRSRARRGAYRRIGTRTRSRCPHPRRHAGDETHRP